METPYESTVNRKFRDGIKERRANLKKNKVVDRVLNTPGFVSGAQLLPADFGWRVFSFLMPYDGTIERLLMYIEESSVTNIEVAIEDVLVFDQTNQTSSTKLYVKAGTTILDASIDVLEGSIVSVFARPILPTKTNNAVIESPSIRNVIATLCIRKKADRKDVVNVVATDGSDGKRETDNGS